MIGYDKMLFNILANQAEISKQIAGYFVSGPPFDMEKPEDLLEYKKRMPVFTAARELKLAIEKYWADSNE